MINTSEKATSYIERITFSTDEIISVLTRARNFFLANNSSADNATLLVNKNCNWKLIKTWFIEVHFHFALGDYKPPAPAPFNNLPQFAKRNSATIWPSKATKSFFLKSSKIRMNFYLYGVKYFFFKCCTIGCFEITKMIKVFPRHWQS